MSSRAPKAPERAGTREWIALAVLGVPAVLVMMNMSVLYLALPTLGKDLEPSGSQLLWITDIYGFMVAGSLITLGTLGDRIGHRRILLIGAVAFTAASVLAAYSTSAGMLIAARAIQGVAAASLAPSSLSVIRNMFRDPGQRTLAITIWMMSFMGGGRSALSSVVHCSISSGGARCSWPPFPPWHCCSPRARSSCPSSAPRIPAVWTWSVWRCPC